MDKKQIAAVLDEMGTLLELQGANPFKSRAFHAASRSVEGIVGDIGAMSRSGDLLKVKGIGASIGAIIGDLVATGTSKEYTALRKSIPDGVLEMLRIQGLGPKRVKILYDKLKLKSLDALERAARADKLSALAGFGSKTQENILAGISSLRSRKDKYLFSTALHAAHAVFDALAKQPGVIRGEIAGSLRRRKEVIGDIDILLSAKESDRSRLMEVFVHHPDVAAIIAHGETKSSVTLSSGINCDLRIVNDKEFPFALQYFTGSKEHNVALRSRAKKEGLSLNEYGFTPLEEKKGSGGRRKGTACRDEEAIYAALGLQFVPPELREDRGELEAAEANRIPALIPLDSLRGTFHCHTTYSDGVNSLQEMTDAARALGWEYLGIADHSRSAAYAGGLTRERLKEQSAEIDAINGRSAGFRVWKGTECDILPNGDLDWPESILATFDYVVVSVHSSFTLTEAAMTKRIVKALKNRYVTMLGHPTGRLLLSREGYRVNMNEVIAAAAEYGKIIEINAHPTRLDLDWRLCRLAKEKGVMIAINPDAHSVDGLRDVEYGVGIARKGWLEAKDVLNTRSLEDVGRYFDLKKRERSR